MAKEEGRRERGPGVGLNPARAHSRPQGGQSQGTGGLRDLGTDGWTEGGRVRGILPLPEPAQLLVLLEVRLRDWERGWGAPGALG